MILSRSAAVMLVAFVVLSSSAARAQEIYSFPGDSAGDELGRSVSGAGDLDNDGHDDFLAGAPLDDSTGTNAGGLLVFSGKDGSILYSFSGNAASDQFGWSASGAGDVDGDGFADVIAGAIGDGTFGMFAGSARVLSGKDGSIIYTFHGDSAYDEFGWSVSGAGDLDGDGSADVIVGALWDDMSSSDSGTALVFSGVDGSLIHAFTGDSAGDALGSSVSDAGDVDGDGFDDVIVGADRDDVTGSNSGSAQVYSGKNGWILYTFSGDSAEDRLGFSVSGLGDVSGDGVADVIAGAWGDDDNGSACGSARVYSGKDGAILFTFYGDSANDLFGHAVSGPGDANYDGHGDIVVGSPLDDTQFLDSGSALVYSGKDGTTLHAMHGDWAGAEFGRAVSGAGDINADGRGDFVVGAPGDSSTSLLAGQVHAFSGTCGSVAAYGSGCGGSGGYVPSLSLSGCPTPGGTMQVEITGGLAGTNAFLFVGYQQTAIPIGHGCTLNVSPTLGPIGPVPLFGSGAGTGAVAISIRLPINSPLASPTVQAFVNDPGAALGFSSTNGVVFSIQ